MPRNAPNINGISCIHFKEIQLTVSHTSPLTALEGRESEEGNRGEEEERSKNGKMDVIVEFRVGISMCIGGNVTADPRKGMLRVVNIDGLLHFQWLLRDKREAIEPPEVDIVIFPEEANFVQKVYDLHTCCLPLQISHGFWPQSA